jgi:cytochrome c-type biogenesis protein CcmE
MTSTNTKLLVGGLTIAAACAYLGLTGARSGWVYYLDVDAYVQREEAGSKRTRVHGFVGADRLDVRPADLYAQFDLEGETESMRVVYRGAIPDMFQEGGQVVVEGARGDDGVFQADLMMTKCASKYEGKPDSHPVVESGS